MSFWGLDYSYNAEWWYITCWLQFIIAYPFIMKFIDLIDLTSNKIIKIIPILISVILIFVNYVYRPVYLDVWLAFLMGVICAFYPIYQKLDHLISKKRLVGITISIFLILVSFIVRTKVTIYIDYLLVCNLYFAIAYIIKHSIFTIRDTNVFYICGKHAMGIWLLHTFFAYYYFKSIYIVLGIH
ncbi:hypothetical protein P261_00895 [Lachnospiraceae bacterium TWA4]|nr:hypothetical protein P261_00895 [Lachnospiraceae bacterium TWA4]